MTRNELQDFIEANPSVFYKVWATARPEQAQIVEYRFPGLSFTGYFIESENYIMSFLPWLNVEKIEVW